ncbi:MAG TPA: dephospho-CoA kinase [Gemmataceae bacterium]|jgi:dephospho-CoA kinase|nr:dephospho-CoA kinase [Gemmataceae bacterium]
MNKPVIGIVGGIGSGKSFVAERLVALGGHLIVADALGHEGLRQPEIKQTIRTRWGDVVSDSGEVDRRRLAKIVFADETERHALEAILYPYIGRRVDEEIDKSHRDPAIGFVILDAAVLLEAGWRSRCDHILFVDAPRRVRLERVKSRGWTDADLAAREAHQMPLAEKMALADAVLVNDGAMGTVVQRLGEISSKWHLHVPDAPLE